jgi:ribosome-binding protein aMBF1 (putative translation factor)
MNTMAKSPTGTTHRDSMCRRARNPAYRDAIAKLAPYEHLARLVIQRRAAAGWTQAELAARMGTSHSVISRIESGQHPTSITTLERLAEAFDTRLVIGFDDSSTGHQDSPTDPPARRAKDSAQ